MKFLITGMIVLALTVTATAQSEMEAGFTSLFDGQSLAGWIHVGDKRTTRGYVVENGLLVCPSDGGGNLLTTREFANFVLRFDFRMEPGGNNGVGIRAPLLGDIAYQGMEIQILDHDHERYKGRLKPTQLHGSIYDLFPAKTGGLKPAGEWNSQEVLADGRRVQVRLNGELILDADLDSVTDPALLKRHPGLARASGRVGFLGHATRVEFRNIRIKELP